jgi:hypothetical protein
MGDSDGDGLPNIAEAAIDSGARYQARIALITAIVALVSALLGPLVSLKINSDQIESQRKANTAQNVADRGQSESEFRRTQRTTAYTDFLTAFNNGTLDLLGAAGAFAGGSGDADGLATQTQKAIDAVKDVTATFYKVRIVASSKTNEKAEALYGEFGTWSGALLQAFGKILNGVELTAEDESLLTSTSEEYTLLLGLSNDFIETGRDDMTTDEDDG